ncbi:hypothetical protein [Asticcacaulis sp. AC402]|uniref:hypothetical protein n=1 Tax=Asticcacaulis sp. AC402 TaxID=1282361 RepID=UPI0003C3FEEF|nr:hypothetical protein [Asticcacaulis sp. AC402]ESQ74575.1 hypothetical protein ABAC402_13900 [Asticcacaulis sp. AC402]
MRTIITTLTLLAFLPTAATAATFSIDELAPGEGHEGDCYTWMAREGSAVDESRAIFEDVGGRAYIKIDGEVFSLHASGGDRGEERSTAKFENKMAALTVVEDVTIEQASGADNWGAYLVKGKLKVTFQDRTQTVRVKGKSVCEAPERSSVPSDRKRPEGSKPPAAPSPSQPGS